MSPRTRQVCLLAVSLLIAIATVLAAANAAAPHGSCEWKFPKVVGCVLAAREGLAGGLIATAGAIIAGWLAWTAAQRQLALARNSDLRANIGQLADEGKVFARFVQAALQLTKQSERWDSVPELRQDVRQSYLGIIKSTAAKVDELYDDLDRVQLASVGDGSHRSQLNAVVMAGVGFVETALAIEGAIAETGGSFQASPEFTRRSGLRRQFDALVNAAIHANASRARVIAGIREQMT